MWKRTRWVSCLPASVSPRFVRFAFASCQPVLDTLLHSGERISEVVHVGVVSAQMVVAITDGWPRGSDCFPRQRLSPVQCAGFLELSGSWETCSGGSLRSLIVCLPSGYGDDFSRLNSARRRTNVGTLRTSLPGPCSPLRQITREVDCHSWSHPLRPLVVPTSARCIQTGITDVPNGVSDPSLVPALRCCRGRLFGPSICKGHCG